jgi:hypothetical protein
MGCGCGIAEWVWRSYVGCGCGIAEWGVAELSGMWMWYI